MVTLMQKSKICDTEVVTFSKREQKYNDGHKT